MVEVRSVLIMKEEETKDNDGCGEERQVKQQLVEGAGGGGGEHFMKIFRVKQENTSRKIFETKPAV